jgi:hypothetical protein
MSEEVKLDSDGVPHEAEGFSEKEKAVNRPGETETEKRDWVGEAVQCFIKDAKDLDPTDPISAIAHYFAKNASDELKARCKAEGKNATYCWRFIEAVARKALGNRPGHIDPSAIYAIAMHYFEDVPKDWENLPKPKPAAPAKTPTSTPKKGKPKKGKPKKPAETPSEKRKEKERAKKAAAKKAAAKKKPTSQVQQGFFFNLLETPAEAPEQEGGAE